MQYYPLNKRILNQSAIQQEVQILLKFMKLFSLLYYFFSGSEIID